MPVRYRADELDMDKLFCDNLKNRAGTDQASGSDNDVD